MTGANEELRDSSHAPQAPSPHAPPPHSPPPAAANSPREAAERWVAEHADALWRFALSRTRGAEAAEEIVQETLLAAMQRLGGFSGASSERTWLLGIASHKIADHFRRLARTQHREDGGDDEPCGCERCRVLFTKGGKWAAIPANWPELGEETHESAATLDALRQCMEALPPGQREVIWMRDLLDIPAEEVRKSLGLTATNLWTRLHRARAALRTCMERVFGPGRKSEA
jgi:RNA polymerase sigma-70 factor (ECF subfamily)